MEHELDTLLAGALFAGTERGEWPVAYNIAAVGRRGVRENFAARGPCILFPASGWRMTEKARFWRLMNEEDDREYVFLLFFFLEGTIIFGKCYRGWNKCLKRKINTYLACLILLSILTVSFFYDYLHERLRKNYYSKQQRIGF